MQEQQQQQQAPLAAPGYRLSAARPPWPLLPRPSLCRCLLCTASRARPSDSLIFIHTDLPAPGNAPPGGANRSPPLPILPAPQPPHAPAPAVSQHMLPPRLPAAPFLNTRSPSQTLLSPISFRFGCPFVASPPCSPALHALQFSPVPTQPALVYCNCRQCVHWHSGSSWEEQGGSEVGKGRVMDSTTTHETVRGKVGARREKPMPKIVGGGTHFEDAYIHGRASCWLSAAAATAGAAPRPLQCPPEGRPPPLPPRPPPGHPPSLCGWWCG